jgi:hypothetical protein
LTVEDLEDGHLSLSGRFYDRSSKLVLEIVANEWRSFAGSWDVERIANRIVIREAAYKLSLDVVAESSQEITFDNVAMNYRNIGLVSREGDLIEITHNGSPVMAHRPFTHGGMGIETRGSLDIDEDGRIAPITGGSVIGPGTLQVGIPDQRPQAASRQPYVREGPKVGRNDSCPCGSGKKYKHCHLAPSSH